MKLSQQSLIFVLIFIAVQNINVRVLKWGKNEMSPTPVKKISPIFRTHLHYREQIQVFYQHGFSELHYFWIIFLMWKWPFREVQNGQPESTAFPIFCMLVYINSSCKLLFLLEIILPALLLSLSPTLTCLVINNKTLCFAALCSYALMCNILLYF